MLSKHLNVKTLVASFYKGILSFNHQLTTVNCYLWVDAPLNAITGEESHTKGGKAIKNKGSNRDQKKR